jgi:hypothetical protein
VVPDGCGGREVKVKVMRHKVSQLMSAETLMTVHDMKRKMRKMRYESSSSLMHSTELSRNVSWIPIAHRADDKLVD